MRNLKKVLSLSLALVMLLGMMVVGAGAAAYTDTVDSEKEEAIEVMSAVKIITGDGTGSFNPDSTLDRAQAAVIIARVLLTPDVVTKLGAVECQFTDVTPYPWAMAPIQACANAGVIKGYDETTFGPTDKVTGVQFAVMLLRLLGFDDSAYTGATWELAARQDAIKAGLDANGVSITSTPMTREDAAQMAMNALVYSPSGEKVYTCNGQTFDSFIEAYLYSNNNTYPITVSTAKDSLATTRFNLVSDTKTDDFGREINIWKVGKDEVYASNTTATAPVVTYTAKTSSSAVDKELKGYVYTNLTKKNVITNGTPEADADAQSATITSNATLAGVTGNGKVVEVYANSSKQITKVIVMEYSVDTLRSITEKNGRTTYSFATAASKYNDDDNTNVILEGSVGEGDVVTIATVDGKYHVYPTTSFTANQTAKKESSGTVTVTLGGAQYVVATGYTNIADASAFTNSKDEATYFVDMNGYVVAVKGAEEAKPEYAVIAGVAANASTVTLDNPTGYTVNVRAVLADGTVADYTLATALTTEANQYGTTSALGSLVAGSGSTRVLLCEAANLESNLQTNASTALTGKAFAYTVNGKDQMVISAMADATGMTADETYLLTMNNGYKGTTAHAGKDSQSGTTGLFTNKTVFVIYNKDGNKVTAEAHTGTIGLAIDKTSGVDGGLAVITASAADQGAASVVFLQTTTVAAAVDYVFVDPSNAVSILKADGTGSTWEYTGITPDGSEIKVTADGEKLTKIGLYEYDTDMVLNTTAKIKEDDAAATGSAVASSFNRLANATANSGLIKVGDTWVNITEDTQIVYTKSTLDEIKNVKCFVVIGSSTAEVDAIFVYDAVAEGEGGGGEEGGEEGGEKTAAATIGDIAYEDTTNNSIHVEGDDSSANPAKGATVTITLADTTVTKDKITVSNSNTSDFTVAVGEVTDDNGTKKVTLTITAVADTAKESTFTVKVAAVNTEDYKDTEVKTITVKIAAKPV